MLAKNNSTQYDIYRHEGSEADVDALCIGEIVQLKSGEYVKHL